MAPTREAVEAEAEQATAGSNATVGLGHKFGSGWNRAREVRGVGVCGGYA